MSSMPPINPSFPNVLPPQVKAEPEQPTRQGSDPIHSTDNGFSVRTADGRSMLVDIGTLTMMLSLKRVENMDQQLAFQLTELKDRNLAVSVMTRLLAMGREMAASGKAFKGELTIEGKTQSIQAWAKQYSVPLEKMNVDRFWSNLFSSVISLIPGGELGLKIVGSLVKELDDTMTHYLGDKNPINWVRKHTVDFAVADIFGGGAGWDARFQNNLSQLKSASDSVQTDSQSENTKLQNILEKRNNAFEMATRVMQTNNQSVQATLRGL